MWREIKTQIRKKCVIGKVGAVLTCDLPNSIFVPPSDLFPIVDGVFITAQGGHIHPLSWQLIMIWSSASSSTSFLAFALLA